MSSKLSGAIVLDASTEDVWEACKHSDTILCDYFPEYFSNSEYVHGHGEPGSVRQITLSHGNFGRGQVKERIDKVDEETKTFAYTLLGGDPPHYRSFSTELHFVPHGSSTEAMWTVNYDPVGNLDHQKHICKTAETLLKTLERAVQAVRSRKTMKHTEILQASPEAIWEALKLADIITCKTLPDHFESTRMALGYGGPGSVRIITTGPAITYAREITELTDVEDDANMKLGYTVLKGDPRYKRFAATMQFSPGPVEGTTSAEWVATYVPEGDMGPPEHIKAVVVKVWNALADATKACS